jgi:signal transduction histidine kinase
MGVPLVVLDKVVGMLSLTRRERNAFTSDDATLAMAFAGQAAILLESSRMYDQVAGLNEELERKVEARTEELANAYKVLEKLDKTKADFIGVSAHELRTPLTVISGYANMLNADPAIKNNPSKAALMEGILNGVGRMVQVINNMLDVTRIDSDVLDMQKTPSHLSVIFERVVAEFKGALDERRLTLEVTGLSRLPMVYIDPNLMYKVFYHLIINAIKYTPDGGYISVKGRVTRAPEIGDVIEVQVTDTGIGIAPEHQKLIFEKFYQTGKLALHSSGATKFAGGGPGLGLAIARGIVVAHGGRIWVESPGCDEVNYPGSRFFVQIPLIRPGTAPLPPLPNLP